MGGGATFVDNFLFRHSYVTMTLPAEILSVTHMLCHSPTVTLHDCPWPLGAVLPPYFCATYLTLSMGPPPYWGYRISAYGSKPRVLAQHLWGSGADGPPSLLLIFGLHFLRKVHTLPKRCDLPSIRATQVLFCILSFHLFICLCLRLCFAMKANLLCLSPRGFHHGFMLPCIPR